MSATTPEQIPFEPQPPATIERNFRLGVLNGILFIFSETIFDPTLVITSFASLLTNSSFILGIFTPISNAGWYLPQFFVSSLVQSQPRKITVYQRMSFIRIACWAMLAAAVNLVRDPVWILATLIFAYSIASLASGIGGLPFLEVVSKTVPPHRRGELFAWRLGLGGLLGIAASGLVRWLVDPGGPVAFPGNYGILALAFFIMASISLMIFNRVDEYPDRETLPKRSIKEQLTVALNIVRGNQNYRFYILLQACMFIGMSVAPFYAVFLYRELGGSTEWVGIYLAVGMVANLLSNLTFGWLSRKAGNQKVMLIATSCGITVSLLMLALVLFAKPLGIQGNTAAMCLIPIFFIQGMRGTASGVSSSGLMLNIIPAAERSVAIGFVQSFVGVVLLFTMATGVLVDAFGYALPMTISFLAYVASLLLVRQIHEHPN